MRLEVEGAPRDESRGVRQAREMEVRFGVKLRHGGLVRIGERRRRTRGPPAGYSQGWLRGRDARSRVELVTSRGVSFAIHAVALLARALGIPQSHLRLHRVPGL